MTRTNLATIAWFVFWIAIGSIVLSFIFRPGSLNHFTETIGDSFGSSSSAYSAQQQAKAHPSIEINVPDIFGVNRCSNIEAGAQELGISYDANKKRMCTYFCGNEDKEYDHHVCEKDKLRCFCQA